MRVWFTFSRCRSVRGCQTVCNRHVLFDHIISDPLQVWQQWPSEKFMDRPSLMTRSDVHCNREMKMRCGMIATAVASNVILEDDGTKRCLEYCSWTDDCMKERMRFTTLSDKLFSSSCLLSAPAYSFPPLISMAKGPNDIDLMDDNLLQVAEMYAFLPREAVTRFLMSCSDCQKRMHLQGISSNENHLSASSSSSP